MIREHWKKIGIWVDVVELERGLWLKRIEANDYQLTLRWGNTGTEIPFISTWSFLPVMPRSEEGPLYGTWYASGGKSSKKPEDPLILQGYELLRKAKSVKEEERIAIGKELWKLHVDQVWTIGTVGLGPAILGVRVVKNNMGNVPQRLSINRNTRTPGGSHPSTYFFKS
jgi:peptide/nickel transport system substrate-binding protein